MKFVRGIAGVVGGLLFTFLMVQAAEMIVHRMHPPPAQIADVNAAKAYVATLPASALLVVLAGWLVGTLGGTSIAARIGRSRMPAYVIGAILLAAGIATAVTFPQPVWFSIAVCVVYVAATFLGAGLGSIKRDLEAAAAA
jgi:hypothetical protein